MGIYTNGQIHGHTYTRMHYNEQIDGHTDTQIHRQTNALMNRYTDT